MIKMKLQYVVWWDVEYDEWIASCIEYDMVTQGNSKKEAIDSLERTIIGQIHIDIKRGLKPLQDIDKPPIHISELEIVYEPPLLPCPFCGEEPRFIQRDDEDEEFDFDIGCGTNECYLDNGADWWISKEEAIDKWNTRISND